MARPTRSELASRKRCHRWLRSGTGRRLPGLRPGRLRLLWLQVNDRDDPCRLLLVPQESRIFRSDLREQPVTFVAGGDASFHGDRLAEDLDGRLRVGCEIVIPGRI